MTKEEKILEEMREFYGCEEHGCTDCPGLILDADCDVTAFANYIQEKEGKECTQS